MTKELKFTKGEQNLAKKYNLDLELVSAPATFNVSNPFSGETVTLNEFGLILYSNIMTLYRKYQFGHDFNVKEYDRLRYLFLKIFPSEYMALLD